MFSLLCHSRQSLAQLIPPPSARAPSPVNACSAQLMLGMACSQVDMADAEFFEAARSCDLTWRSEPGTHSSSTVGPERSSACRHWCCVDDLAYSVGMRQFRTTRSCQANPSAALYSVVGLRDAIIAAHAVWSRQATAADGDAAPVTEEALGGEDFTIVDALEEEDEPAAAPAAVSAPAGVDETGIMPCCARGAFARFALPGTRQCRR